MAEQSVVIRAVGKAMSREGEEGVACRSAEPLWLSKSGAKIGEDRESDPWNSGTA